MVGPQKKKGLRALRHGWATQKKGQNKENKEKGEV
jgi:hypothetical protein